MKLSSLVAVAALALVSTSAFATQNHTCQGGHNCNTTPSNTSQNQQQGQQQGQAQGQLQGQIANGGSVKNSGNSSSTSAAVAVSGDSNSSVKNSGNSSNTNLNSNTAFGGKGGEGGDANVKNSVNTTDFNSNAQGQSQSVKNSGNSDVDVKNTNNNSDFNSQGQSQSVKNSGNSAQGQSQSNDANNSNSNEASGNNTEVTVEGDNVTYKAAKIPVATAYAASLTSGFDTCLGSSSGALQTSIVGLSFGKTKTDKNCVVIKRTHLIAGFSTAAGCEYMLAHVPGAAEAFKAAGAVCTPPVAVASSVVAEEAAPAPAKQEVVLQEVELKKNGQ